MARPITNDDTVRNSLLSAAVALLAAMPAEQVSVRAIAAKAGCSTTAIYTLYGGRDGLLAAVRAEAVSAFGRAMHEAATKGDVDMRLHALAEAYLGWASDHPHLYGVLFQGVQQFQPAGSASPEDPAAPLMDIIDDGLKAGRLAGPPAAIAASMWVCLHGIATLRRDHAISPETAQITLHTATEALLRGWNPSPDSGSSLQHDQTSAADLDVRKRSH